MSSSSLEFHWAYPGYTHIYSILESSPYSPNTIHHLPSIDTAAAIIDSIQYIVLTTHNTTILNDTLLQYQHKPYTIQTTVTYSYPALYHTAPHHHHQGHIILHTTNDTHTHHIQCTQLYNAIQQAAVHAIEAYNIQQHNIHHRIAHATLTFLLQHRHQTSIAIVLTNIHNAKAHPQKITYTLKELGHTLVELADKDVDEDHNILLHQISSDLQEFKDEAYGDFHLVFQSLINYLEKSRSDGVKDGNPNILLKQQRLIIMVADLLWVLQNSSHPISLSQILSKEEFKIFLSSVSSNIDTQDNIAKMISKIPGKKNMEDEHFSFVDPFFKAANEKELSDFEICTQNLIELLHSKKKPCLKWTHSTIPSSFTSQSGMRIGLSSANASDNWTNAKLRGGKVINFSVNLYGQPPVSSTFSRKHADKGSPILTLISTDSLSGQLSTSQAQFDQSNILELEHFNDPKDPFRMLKYSFFFVGILKENSNAKEMLSDLSNFGDHCALSLSVTNVGPSRSGFASSSAVSSNLLKVLYKASGQDDIVEDSNTFGSLVLLFENRLGLKSGRQDVDGLLPGGFKNISYGPTYETLLPVLDDTIFADSNFSGFPKNLVVVDSGIQRSTHLGRKRGLNMRHSALLSRNCQTFSAIRKSYGVHEQLIDAFVKKDWQRIGQLFLTYMSLREEIDPGATMSIFDELYNGKLLRALFDPLKDEGLIHGGMFTGAMGGGVAMLISTAKGQDTHPSSQTNLEFKLNELKQLELGPDKIRPFGNLRIFEYSINPDGVTLSINPPLLSL